MRTPTPQGSHGVVSLSPNLLPPCLHLDGLRLCSCLDRRAPQTCVHHTAAGLGLVEGWDDHEEETGMLLVVVVVVVVTVVVVATVHWWVRSRACEAGETSGGARGGGEDGMGGCTHLFLHCFAWRPHDPHPHPPSADPELLRAQLQAWFLTSHHPQVPTSSSWAFLAFHCG